MQSDRTYKVIFFDMDGVLIDVSNFQESGEKVAVSTWHAVFDGLGIRGEHERLKEQFKAGAFPSYMEWTDTACQVLQSHGLTERQFTAFISNRPFMTGAVDAISELKERGYRTAVITGSFGALAKRVQDELGINEAVAHCNFTFDAEGKLKEWQLVPCDYDGKVDTFIQLTRQYGVEPTECIYVGDEVNDIPIFEKAGLAIAFNCRKKSVRDAADIVVDGKDLREILKVI